MNPAFSSIVAGAELVESFAEIGVSAFTTSRLAGSFGMGTTDPVVEVISRWSMLREYLGGIDGRLATSYQVHGAEIIEHEGMWRGSLRGPEADGHVSWTRGTAMAVTVADCVPVFIAHPSGATAALHSGWRGTVAGITERAIARFQAQGCRLDELRLHCGPAICGKCYEVSPEVHGKLGLAPPMAPAPVDLRATILDRARSMGVKKLTASLLCTRCDNHRFYSYRAGDAGRQLGVILAGGNR